MAQYKYVDHEFHTDRPAKGRFQYYKKKKKNCVTRDDPWFLQNGFPIEKLAFQKFVSVAAPHLSRRFQRHYSVQIRIYLNIGFPSLPINQFKQFCFSDSL